MALPTLPCSNATTNASTSAKGRLIPPPSPTGYALSNVPLIPPASTDPVAPPTDLVPPTGAVDVGSVVEGRVDPIAADLPDTNTVVNRSAPPENDMIARWRLERDQSREELGTVSLASEMTQSHAENDFAPELPADLLDAEKAGQPVRPPISVLAEKKAQRFEHHRPELLDQVGGLEEGPRVREETVQQMWDRWRRSLPNRKIVTAVVVMLCAVWWFWPRSSRGIYDRYVSIWEEWKTRRTDLKDQSGWEQFLRRTENELNVTVPYLAQHARASDREKQLLLFVGRDCLQKMLEQPRQIGSTREKQLQILFVVLREMYEPPADGKHTEAVLEISSPPRRKSGSNQATNDAAESGRVRPAKKDSPRSDALPEERSLERQP